MSEYAAAGAYWKPDQRDRYGIMSQYYRKLAERPDKDTLGKMKQFASYFTHGVRDGARLRAAIYRAGAVAEVRDLVDAFFESDLDEAAA
jgi:tRNA-dihydrouridine synthase